MKSDTVFKRSVNEFLNYVADLPVNSPLQPETRLAEMLDVSRTTVRKVLAHLARNRILASGDTKFVVVRKPKADDYFPQDATVAAADQVEKKFKEWMLREDRKPGDYINGLELAREFNLSTNSVREYLNRFARFGLVEKRPNSGWVFRGFTIEFAMDLLEVRELFEIRSAKAFADQPADSPSWAALRQLEAEHRKLLIHIKTRYHDFSSLDERLHRLIYDASRNRFIADFYEVISLIFHYHYQWHKAAERERNAIAVHEHLAYIEALMTRNPDRIEAACRRHLRTARRTLLSAIT